MLLFHDRRDAGRKLADHLKEFRRRKDVLVVALPRGGVPIAFEVAQALRVPLDVLMVRKIGAPGNEEYAIGAIASGGVELLDDEVISQLRIPRGEVDELLRQQKQELARREDLYRPGRRFPNVEDRIVIVVDDGLATGATMTAAVTALRRLGAKRIIVAAPVCASDSCSRMRAVADDCICAASHYPLRSVGEWYADFSQTSDEEVLALLDEARTGRPAEKKPAPIPDMRW